MKSLPERLEHLMATLEGLDRSERIQMLVDVAKQFRRVPEEIAQRPYPAEHRVPGCESEAYVWAAPREDGTSSYYFAVENPQGISAMALSAILSRSLSGAPLEAVAEVPGDIVYRIFGRELSMGKSLGLMGIVNMVRAAARQQLRSSSNTAESCHSAAGPDIQRG
jgi:cysteine desulfuration protein SufE